MVGREEWKLPTDERRQTAAHGLVAVEDILAQPVLQITTRLPTGPLSR